VIWGTHNLVQWTAIGTIRSSQHDPQAFQGLAVSACLLVLLQLLLIMVAPDTYLAWRTPLMLFNRLTRLLATLSSTLPAAEIYDKLLGKEPAEVQPADGIRAVIVLLGLLPLSILLQSITLLLPFRWMLPMQTVTIAAWHMHIPTQVCAVQLSPAVQQASQFLCTAIQAVLEGFASEAPFLEYPIHSSCVTGEYSAAWIAAYLHLVCVVFIPTWYVLCLEHWQKTQFLSSRQLRVTSAWDWLRPGQDVSFVVIPLGLALCGVAATGLRQHLPPSIC
jgi:hypothetical protein